MSKKLPFVTSDIPRDLRTYLDRLRELVAGTGGDRLVSADELANAGLASVDAGGNLTAPRPYLATPPAPTNVAASGAIQNIIVTWNDPTYVGHAYAEVWGSSTDNLGQAVLLGLSPGSIYVDSTGPSTSRYYWVRFVNTENVSGPYNALSGVLGQTGSDVTYMLNTLTTAALDPASPYAKYAVRADFFYVAPKLDFNQEATPVASSVGNLWYQPSSDRTRTWTGTTWGPFSQTLPFVINTVPQTINGVDVPAGVYMDAAFIKDGTITNAKIGNAVIDDAKIVSLSAAKLTAGSVSVGEYIQSSDYVIGTQGWKIHGNGTAEFQTVIVRGTVYATSGTIGGITIASNAVRSGQTAWDTGAGFFLGSDGKFSLGNSAGKKLTWNGTNLSISGDIIAGTVGGSEVGTTYVRSANYVSGSAGWEIDSNGDAEFNQLTVRSGQVTGALLKITAIPIFNSGLYYEISSGTPISTTDGPYYFTGSTNPYYLAWSGTMPAPETASHRIAAAVTLNAFNGRGGAGADLVTFVAVNSSITGTTINAEVVGISSMSSLFGLSTTTVGSTAGLYSTAVPVSVFVSGFNCQSTVGTISGMFWGVR